LYAVTGIWSNSSSHY